MNPLLGHAADPAGFECQNPFFIVSPNNSSLSDPTLRSPYVQQFKPECAVFLVNLQANRQVQVRLASASWAHNLSRDCHRPIQPFLAAIMLTLANLSNRYQTLFLYASLRQQYALGVFDGSESRGYNALQLPGEQAPQPEFSRAGSALHFPRSLDDVSTYSLKPRQPNVLDLQVVNGAFPGFLLKPLSPLFRGSGIDRS